MSLRPKRVQFADVWPSLSRQFEALLLQENLGQFKLMEVYQTVYDLCVALPRPHVQPLFEAIEALLQQHCDSVLVGLLDIGCHNEVLLERYVDRWARFHDSVGWMNYCCGYLNKLIQNANHQHGGQTHHPRIKRLAESHNQGLKGKPTIDMLALDYWRQHVLLPLRTEHSNLLMRTVLQVINDLRLQMPATVSVSSQKTLKLLQATIRSCVTVSQVVTDHPMRVYVDEFEAKYLDQLKQFYANKAKHWNSEMPVSAYLKQALETIKWEDAQICSLVCDESSWDKTRKVMDAELIMVFQTRIEAELAGYFEQFDKNGLDSRINLGNAFEALVRLPDGLDAFVEVFYAHIVKSVKSSIHSLILSEGTFIGKESSLVVSIVERLIQHHVTFGDLIKVEFHSDLRLVTVLDRALRTLMNDRHLLEPFGEQVTSIPEMLVRVCDLYLKKSASAGMSTLTDEEVTRKMDAVLGVFRYLDDKDVFQKFYARALAKRLIHPPSLSKSFTSLADMNDTELEIIEKLRKLCGQEYTSRMTRMVLDVQLSRGDMSVWFKQWIKDRQLDIPFESHVLVLAAGTWPLSVHQNSAGGDNDGMAIQPSTSADTVVMPKLFGPSVAEFEKMYKHKYSGRKLTFLHHLTRVDVRMWGYDRIYDINISGTQYAILSLFEATIGSEEDETGAASFQVESLGQTLGNVNEVVKSIGPLIDIGLLSVVSSEAVPEATEGSKKKRRYAIDSSSMLQLNYAFSLKRNKIRVPPYAAHTTTRDETAESKATQRSIDEDRLFFLQSAIVRVLKSHHRLSKDALFKEVAQVTSGRFSIHMSVLLKCLAMLEEKEYVEKLDNGETWQYVA